MFWGLIMEPNKRYTQTVERSFHVSMAALDCSSAENEQIQVMLSVDKKNYLLCTLHPKHMIQTSLDLNFQSGDEIAFMSNGKGHVHLTGYLVPEDDISNLMDMDEGEEEASDEEVPELSPIKPQKRKGQNELTGKNKKSKLSDIFNTTMDDDDDEDDTFEVTDENIDRVTDESDDDDDDDEEDDDDDDDDDDEETEEESEEETPSKKKQVNKMHNGKMEKQKPEKQIKGNKTPSKESQMNNIDKTPKSKTPKQEKTPRGDKTPKSDKTSKQEKTPKGNKTPGQEGGITPQKRTVEGGVFIEDLKVGSGPVAKPGKMVQVYYEGRLKSNNKVFDSTTQGAGFKFRLGKREVIQGWDIGVAGMRVGGKRKIICPPHMAYGAKGSPPVIPANSTLVFEVELKNVN